MKTQERINQLTSQLSNPTTTTKCSYLSPGPHPSKEELIATLDAQGYVVIPNYITKEKVKEIRDDLLRVIKELPSGRNNFEGFETKRIYALFAKTRTFDELAIDPLLMSVCEAILGRYIQLSSPTGISIGPGEKEQIPHRDGDKYPLPRSYTREVVINTMWAIDDFTEENGATVIYPKTHKPHLRLDPNSPSMNAIMDLDSDPSRYHVPEDDNVPPMSAVMPAGSVMIYVGTLLHGGGANKTKKPRIGVILEYAAAWLRQQENHSLAVPGFFFLKKKIQFFFLNKTK